MTIWARVPRLPVEYYNKHILWRIGDSIRVTIKVDNKTLRKKGESKDGYTTERARFARICVEVDLKKTLVPSFELHGRIYQVEYEGLHLICFYCG